MGQAISLNSVSYTYLSRASQVKWALNNVSLEIPGVSFTMIVGKTGSGKSTLAQICDALLKPTSGSVRIGSFSVNSRTRRSDLLPIYRNTGIIFQIPEDQLFGTTVARDLSFAPRNFGMRKGIWASVRKISQLVGLPFRFLKASPFDLSGGQMRQVAVGSVLIYRPKIIILDEPTVGLDYRHRNLLMKLLRRLNQKYRLTIVMVTHEMALVAKYASRVVVMSQGRVLAVTTPRRLFSNQNLLKDAGLLQPFAPHFASLLKKRGVDLPRLPLTISELADELGSQMKS